MNLQTKILRVEEKINSFGLTRESHGALEKHDIDTALKRRAGVITAADYVIAMLPGRGFRGRGGEADWVRFYRYARIEPDVWSTFSGNTHAPSKETLLKIIIALRLSEDEAREFLSLAGSGFRSEDYRDRVILACMDCGYYEIEDVYMILEEYGGVMVNGKRRFKNIYKDL